MYRLAARSVSSLVDTSKALSKLNCKPHLNQCQPFDEISAKNKSSIDKISDYCMKKKAGFETEPFDVDIIQNKTAKIKKIKTKNVKIQGDVPEVLKTFKIKYTEKDLPTPKADQLKKFLKTGVDDYFKAKANFEKSEELTDPILEGIVDKFGFKKARFETYDKNIRDPFKEVAHNIG